MAPDQSEIGSPRYIKSDYANSRAGKGQPPLAGMIMCCTSIPPDQRQGIATQVIELGGQHMYDLTSDVTHLIVGSVNTTKYQYVAKERPDVVAVLPSFIQAVRQSWLAGEEPDVAVLEDEHRAPTLFGLRICTTGFEELEVRESLNAKFKANGGAYECDLIKGTVTTLIAKKPEGRKHEYARRWNIPVVSLKWLTASLERGMALETAPFDPLLPSEEQGRDIGKPKLSEMVTLGKRQREDIPLNALAISGKRKLRRTMSSKLESKQENIWADIADAATVRPLSEPVRESEDLHRRAENQKDTRLEQGELSVNGNGVRLEEVPANSLSNRSKPPRLFHGVNVCIYGFEGKKLTILREHLSSRGANLATIDELDPEKLEGRCFLIVPHETPKFMLPPIPDSAAQALLVTEWWVESCMHKNIVVDPRDDPLSKPFAKLSIEGLEGLVVCSTGFKDSDLLHVSKVVQLMKGTYDEYLKPTTSILICQSKTTNVEKLRYAGEHNIPVVSEHWLWDSIDVGVVQEFENYTMQPISLQPSNTNDGNKQPRQSPRQTKPASCPSQPTPTQSRKSGTLKKLGSSAPKPLRELSTEELNVPNPSLEKEESEQAKNVAPAKSKALAGNASIETPLSPIQESNSTSISASDTVKESIVALLAHKGEALARRTWNPENAVGNLSRRKRRLLGRAASGASNTSSANELAESLPVASQVDGRRFGLPPPTQSQKIGWGDKHEAESNSIVRDAIIDGGGAARAAGRRTKAS